MVEEHGYLHLVPQDMGDLNFLQARDRQAQVQANLGFNILWREAMIS